MFEYTDPTGTNLLRQTRALEIYRAIVDAEYDRSARTPNSAFTWVEAFDGLGRARKASSAIAWRAFPVTSTSSHAEIDEKRFTQQDEYVEWIVRRNATGDVTAVEFSTEFREYYEALAARGMDALVRGIRDLYRNAQPKRRELFGTTADPARMSPRVRRERFRANLEANPWNNGITGILALTHANNSMGALFKLVTDCAVPNTDVLPDAVCGLVACVPERSSDPRVCVAAQEAARAGVVLSLADPAGIVIESLAGNWSDDSGAIDIARSDHWRIFRNGRRATLAVTPDLRLEGRPITTGAQAAELLQVQSTVISAGAADVPEWARTGKESMRRDA